MTIFRGWAFGLAGLRAAGVAALCVLGAMVMPDAAQAQTGVHERVGAIVARLRSANVDKCAERAVNCGGRLLITDDNQLNAWSDGRNVAVTVRMARFAAEDDALAFVIAHEMAHNLLGHAERLRGVSHNFTDDETMARIRQTEVEADALAVELIKTAGFDPTAAERLLQRMAKRRKVQMPASYPSMAQRISLVRMEVDALDQVDRIAAMPDDDHLNHGGATMAAR